MPGSLSAWYSSYDLEALAERRAVLTGEIELRQLTRLREILHSDVGSIRASFEFHRRTTLGVTVDLKFATDLEFVCQRCLEPLAHRVSEEVALTLMDPAAARSEMAKEEEAVVVVDGKLNPVSLVEDELIVSLPIVPRHENIDECGNLVQVLRAVTPDDRPGKVIPHQKEC